MKTTIVGLAVLLIAAFSVNAQSDKPVKPGHQQHGRHHGRDMMAKNLDFSDAQQQQLKSINGDYHKKLRDLKKNEDITVRESNAQISSLQKEHKAQIQALLTTEQKDKLASMKQQRMEKRKATASARAAKMKATLGLSDDQASQLKTLRTAMVEKRKSLHADNSLSREQKHAAIKTLAVQQKDQLKTILTPTQLQQLEAMKQQHHRREFTK
ncbi:MAG: hypothetical protein ABIU63_12800 [Chitinophagaceae bacterium]